MSERRINIQGDSERNVIIAGDGNVINIGAEKQSSKETRDGSAIKSADISDTSDKNPLIFLCHATEDKPAVRSLYEKLTRAGFKPWMDVIDILPGMEWDYEVRQAMKRTDFVLVCLSEISVQKRGYLNKEIRWASDRQDEMLPGDIFMIPVKLEKCDLPDHLSHWQSVDLFEEGGFERLVKALKYQWGKIASDHQISDLKPDSNSNKGKNNMLSLEQKKRLKQKYDELQMRYNLVSENIGCLTEDYHNETDLLRKNSLKRRLDKEVNERDTLEKQMDDILKKLDS